MRYARYIKSIGTIRLISDTLKLYNIHSPCGDRIDGRIIDRRPLHDESSEFGYQEVNNDEITQKTPPAIVATLYE